MIEHAEYSPVSDIQSSAIVEAPYAFEVLLSSGLKAGCMLDSDEPEQQHSAGQVDEIDGPMSWALAALLISSMRSADTCIFSLD